MHGGSVIGASPGATGAAVVTVQGDGVIVYDVETQVRILAARRLVERDRTPSPPLSRPSLAPRLCSPPPPPPGRPRTHPPRVVRVSPARPASNSPSPRYPRPRPQNAHQERLRSWAVGHGHAFAAPAVYDPISARYFAALVPPGDPSADPSLVSWSNDDRSPSLDAAVDSAAAARLPDGLAALVPAQSGRGGVLAVDASGAVRWFGADARKIAASRRESESADAAGEEDDDQTRRAKKAGAAVARAPRRPPPPAPSSSSPRRASPAAAASSSSRARVEAAAVPTGSRGAAVLHLAAGDERESGASVTPAWSVALTAAPGRERGDATDPNARVVAASASADELVVLWSNAVWAAYDPTETKKADEAKEEEDDEAKEGDDEATTTPRTVSPRRTCSLALDDDAGDGGGAGNKKKRAAGAVASGGSASETRSSETSLAAVRLPAASATSLGGGHHLVARVGVGGARGALVATLDSKYGAVHGAMDASSSSEGEGAGGSGLRGRVDGGVRVEALVGSGGSAPPPPARSRPPPRFSAARPRSARWCAWTARRWCVISRRSGPSRSPPRSGRCRWIPTAAAAALAMGREGVARAAAPPFGGAVAVPRLPEIPPDARGDVIEFEAFDPGSFEPDRSAVEALDAARAAFESATLEPGGSKKSGAATTQPLKKSGGAKRAAAVTAALEPYLRRTETAPREFVSAAIAACVLESLWDPVLALIDAGLVPDSTVAGGS